MHDKSVTVIDTEYVMYVVNGLTHPCENVQMYIIHVCLYYVYLKLPNIYFYCSSVPETNYGVTCMKCAITQSPVIKYN